MQTHETINGIVIEYDPDAEVQAFLDHVRELAAGSGTTANDLVLLIYSNANPLLGPYPFGDRGAVTRETLANPAYHVLTDILYRQEMAERGVAAETLAATYTLTLAEGAELAGVSKVALRKAALESRVPTWVKGGQYFFRPSDVERFAGAGDGRRKQPAEGQGSGPLEVTLGSKPGVSFRLLGDRAPGDLEKVTGNVRQGTVPGGWSRLCAAFSKDSNGEKRLFAYELVPGDTEEAIDVDGFGIRGKFRVERKVSDRKATELLEAFRVAGKVVADGK